MTEQFEAHFFLQLARALLDEIMPALANQGEYLQAQMFSLYSILKYYGALQADAVREVRRRAEACELVQAWARQLAGQGYAAASRRVDAGLRDQSLAAGNTAAILEYASGCLQEMTDVPLHLVTSFHHQLQALLRRHHDELVEELVKA